MRRKRLTLVIVPIIVLVLAFSVIWLQGASAPIGTATTFAMVSTNYQRKAFYADGYHWLFHCNYSHILYSASKDGSTWSGPNVVREGASSSAISVWYDGKVHYVHASAIPGEPVLYRRGTITGDTIQWEPERTAVKGFKGTYHFMTNSEVGSGIWSMEGSRPERARADTTTSIKTGDHPAGSFFLMQPGVEVEAPHGTSPPASCTGKGWRTADRLNTIFYEGTWRIILELSNRSETEHTGRLYVRLWKSPDPDVSRATPLTDWVESAKEIDFSPSSPPIRVIFPTIPTMIFNNEFLFAEFGWMIESEGSDESAGLILFSGGESSVTTSTFEYYNGFCVIDSEGFPWASFFRNDGFYWHSIVVKANKRDGSSWSSPFKLSEPSTGPWRTTLLPLSEGRIYAIYATEAEVKGRLWNGSEWGDEETISMSGLVHDYGYSAVTNKDEVHIVLLEDETNDVIHYKRSPENGWHEQTVQRSQDHISLPVLSLDEQSDNLYCFWAYENTVNMKKLVDGAWEDSSIKPFGTSSQTIRGLSCFYQAWDGKIGVAILTKTNDLFYLRYNHVDTS